MARKHKHRPRKCKLCRKCAKSIFGKGWNGDTTNENVVSKLRRLSIMKYLRGKGIKINKMNKKNGK